MSTSKFCSELGDFVFCGIDDCSLCARREKEEAEYVDAQTASAMPISEGISDIKKAKFEGFDKTAEVGGWSNSGMKDADGGIVWTKAPDQSKSEKRTDQLLNELYHDRARLEKVVADAVQVVDILLAYIEDGATVDRSEDLCIGIAMQFMDSHGADSND